MTLRNSLSLLSISNVSPFVKLTDFVLPFIHKNLSSRASAAFDWPTFPQYAQRVSKPSTVSLLIILFNEFDRLFLILSFYFLFFLSLSSCIRVHPPPGHSQHPAGEQHLYGFQYCFFLIFEKMFPAFTDIQEYLYWITCQKYFFIYSKMYESDHFLTIHPINDTSM